MPGKFRVLIIIPAYNEEASLPGVIHEIKSCAPEADILVVNDCSKDKTAEAASGAGAYVVTLPFNLGIGGAVQTGYKIASRGGYDAAVQVDGDGQHDPRYLSSLLRPLAENQLDCVIGSRFLVQDNAFKSTFTRRIGIRFFCRLLSLITGLFLTDPTSGFRACNNKMIRVFARYYPVDFPEPEAIQIAKRHGARVGEIPVQMRERSGGQSSIRALASLYYMLKVTLAILIDKIKQKPGEKIHAD